MNLKNSRIFKLSVVLAAPFVLLSFFIDEAHRTGDRYVILGFAAFIIFLGIVGTWIFSPKRNT